jgi:hypothetical protein
MKAGPLAPPLASMPRTMRAAESGTGAQENTKKCNQNNEPGSIVSCENTKTLHKKPAFPPLSLSGIRYRWGFPFDEDRPRGQGGF